MEAAARRWVEVIGDSPRDALGNATACQPGNGGHQPMGIGMSGVGEKLVGGGCFYHAASVHDIDAVGRLSHNPQRVGLISGDILCRQQNVVLLAVDIN